jgi:adenosylcobinamide-GDP ribazoletransferase
MAGFLLAVEFLTVISLRRARASAERLEHALPFFPLVGALIGGAQATLDWLATPLLARGVRDALLMVFAALITGLLHLDGFVDCCDALLGTRSVERRLDILRDSRVGAYGAVGGALYCLTWFAALEALPAAARPVALVTAPLLGRWSMVYAVTRFPYARAAGLGSAFHARTRHLVAATCLTLGLLLVLAVFAPRPVATAIPLIVGIVALAMLSWAHWASRRLGGGLTGDTYGALNEIVEIVVLLSFPPLVHLLATGGLPLPL